MSIAAPLVMAFDELESPEFSRRVSQDYKFLADGGGPYLVALCVTPHHNAAWTWRCGLSSWAA